MKRCIKCKKPIEHAFEFCDETCEDNHLRDTIEA